MPCSARVRNLGRGAHGVWAPIIRVAGSRMRTAAHSRSWASHGNPPRTKVSALRSHVPRKEDVPASDVLYDAFPHVVYADPFGETGRSFAGSCLISKELHQCGGQFQDVTVSIDAAHPLATSCGATAGAPQIDVPPLVDEYDVDIAQRRSGPTNRIPLKHRQRFPHSIPSNSHVLFLTHQRFRGISSAIIASFFKSTYAFRPLKWRWKSTATFPP